MKKWETELYAAIVFKEVQKSHKIVCEHPQLVSTIPQEMVDQMFEHSVASNTQVLDFLQKTHQPSLLSLKSCLQNMVKNNSSAPTSWSWLGDEIKRHSINDVRSHIKPIRVLENTFRSSVKSQAASRCLKILQPYLEQNEIDVLTIFARNNGHLQSSRALLKHANLDELEKLYPSCYRPTDPDLPQIQQEIEMERSKRLKKVLKTQITTKAVNVKRKM